MGQMYFGVSARRSRDDTVASLSKKARTVPPPKVTKMKEKGHRFFIEDECVLKMIPEHVHPSKDCRKVIVAAFDMDQTLITTKSGYTFGRNGDDWKFLVHINDFMERKLAQLSADHPQHRVVTVIFTNQNGCLPKFNAKSQQYLRTKLAGITTAMPVFDYAYAAMKAPTPELKAKYRKPGCGMFERLKADLECEVDMELSFYVGDAAGRPGDHSADDMGFAKNAKLTFYVPEEWFIHEHKVYQPLAETKESGDVDSKNDGKNDTKTNAESATNDSAKCDIENNAKCDIMNNAKCDEEENPTKDPKNDTKKEKDEQKDPE